MPIFPVKLIPGVNELETPALNQGGYSSSNLVRWMNGLPQKLGGWAKWFSTQIGSIVRYLHAWEDLNAVSRLAIGALDSLSIATANGTNVVITPQSTTTNPAVSFSTTSTSPNVTITDAGSGGATTLDVIILNTPVSVGGIVLSGPYPVTAFVSSTEFTITAASPATSTVTNGGAVPLFTTTSGAFSVEVTLDNHGQSVGDTVSFVVSTTGGGVTIQGFYTVKSVVDADNYTIDAAQIATSSTSFSMNGGNAQIVYWITPGPPTVGTGFGIGGFGTGGFGTGSTIPTHTGTPITATDWTIDNWGSFILACPYGGPIFSWSPDSGNLTAQIVASDPNTPTANGGIFVSMPQQILVAWGSSVLGIQDPLLINWSTVADFTVWTAAVTNQAGSFRIPRGSMIVGGMQAPLQGLIWTDLAVWSMQYIQPPLVFGFNELASGCGLIGRQAFFVLGTTVFWMSQKGFFALPAGGGVTPIECPVWDVIFQNLDTTNAYKIRGFANSQFNEGGWYFPSLSGGTGENDTYVKLNIEGQWDYGSLVRSAWIDQSVLGPPIGASTNGYIYQHEVSPDADGLPMNPSFQTGDWALSEGWNLMYVDKIWPDMKFQTFDGSGSASVQIVLYGRMYPNDAPRMYGPFTMTSSVEYIDVSIRARLLSMQVQSNDLGSFWRLGNIRTRTAPAGMR